jgi:hypothetical protein
MASKRVRIGVIGVQGIEQGTSLAPSFYDGFRCQQVLDAIQ